TRQASLHHQAPARQAWLPAGRPGCRDRAGNPADGDLRRRVVAVVSVGPAMKCRPGPDGVHLFERCSGMNVLLDEIATSPESWARAPRQVSVALTNACDLECPFCYAPKFAARADAGRVRAWMDELDEAGC